MFMLRNLNYVKNFDVTITLAKLRKFCYVNIRNINLNKIVRVSV